MSLADVWMVRAAEREALLGRVVEMLRADERVVGAWAFGSIGRGAADGWSDVDLRVVVRDEAVGEVLAGRHEMVNAVGEALLEQDVPQNGPPGGAFRIAAYAAEGGLQEIDWTWAPYSGSRPPGDVRVLFGEGALQEAPAAVEWPKAIDERDPVVSRTVFFWAMCPVAAKYVARGDMAHAATMLGMVTAAQGFVRERLGMAGPGESGGGSSEGGLSAGGPSAGGASEDGAVEGRAREAEVVARASGMRPAEALTALRQQCLGMEELLPRLRLNELSTAGLVDGRFVEELYRTFDLVQSTLG